MDVLLGGPEARADLHAHTGLNLLAATGLPEDPAADIDDVDPGLIAPTAENPAHRPPVRDLISLLLYMLPPQELRLVAALAARAGGGLPDWVEPPPGDFVDGENVPPDLGRVSAAAELGSVASEALDRPLDVPLFFINPFERKGPLETAVEEGRAVFRDANPTLAALIGSRCVSRKEAYGVELTDDEVQARIDAYETLVPELKAYLRDHVNVGGGWPSASVSPPPPSPRRPADQTSTIGPRSGSAGCC